MSEAKFLLSILDKFGVPVAMCFGLLFILWWVIKEHKQERAEHFEKYQKLDDRANERAIEGNKAAIEITKALKDLEIVIQLNTK